MAAYFEPDRRRGAILFSTAFPFSFLFPFFFFLDQSLAVKVEVVVVVVVVVSSGSSSGSSSGGGSSRRPRYLGNLLLKLQILFFLSLYACVQVTPYWVQDR